MKTLLCFLTVLCLLLSAGCSVTDIGQKLNPRHTETQTEAQPETEEDTGSVLPPCPVDLMEYMTQNMEVYAYIDIPGTSISYPIVQSRRDDNYYLRRNWKGEHDTSGSIFSQTCNTTEFTDPVTILYGHHTSRGNMFSDLLKYKDEDFFNENNLIYIYLPYGVLIYRIFSSHTFDDRHILNSYDFSNPEVLTEFQQMLLDPPALEKTVAEGVTLNPANHILTLSTCAEPVSGCNARYLVNGVLIDYVFEA